MQQHRLFSYENSTNNNNQPIGTLDYLCTNSESAGQESLNMRDVREEEEEGAGDGNSIIEAAEFDELDECLHKLIR